MIVTTPGRWPIEPVELNPVNSRTTLAICDSGFWDSKSSFVAREDRRACTIGDKVGGLSLLEVEVREADYSRPETLGAVRTVDVYDIGDAFFEFVSCSRWGRIVRTF